MADKSKKMTKKQVIAKANALFKKHTKELKAELNELLNEADMWYGYWCKGDSLTGIVNVTCLDDRNGDLIAVDGEFDDTSTEYCNMWLHTRNELGIGKKKPNK